MLDNGSLFYFICSVFLQVVYNYFVMLGFFFSKSSYSCGLKGYRRLSVKSLPVSRQMTLDIKFLIFIICLSLSFYYLYFGILFSIHQEVASDSFCFLINSSWLLVFILYVLSLFFSGFNLYCWKGIHFS